MCEGNKGSRLLIMIFFCFNYMTNLKKQKFSGNLTEKKLRVIFKNEKSKQSVQKQTGIPLFYDFLKKLLLANP